MELPPHGRHDAGQSPPARARAKSRRGPAASRGAWLIVIAGVTALLAATLTFVGGKQWLLFASDNTNDTLIGASVANTSLLGQDTAEFGHMPIIRVYYPGLPSANAWTNGLPAVNHSAVIVSFNALPSAILSGADDGALSHFFDTAPTGHVIYYSYWHEPEDNIANGQFTAAAYRAAWAHIVALADAADNPDLRSTLILMAWDLDSASHRDWQDYLPSGNIISTLGWDAYPANFSSLTPPAEFMGQAVAVSKAAGLPFGFSEFGTSAVAGRAAWLTDVGNYLIQSGAQFGTLFDSSPPYPSMKLTDAASITAWRNVIALSGPGTSIPVPSPTGGGKPGPSHSGPPIPPQSSARPGIARLAMAGLKSSGSSHIAIKFRLSEASDVTALVINANGMVVRTLSEPTHAAGRVLIRYYGYDTAGQRVPAGTYRVVIVASNANGSGTAEGTLTIGSG
ncbi:MAG: FlgD immunoglobulin-like domain containing protein [Streptosporangiaceae bacterium]